MTNNSDNDWQVNYSDLLNAGTSTSTRRAYQRDVAYFWIWTKLVLNQKEHYPASEETVIRFILDHLGHMSDENENYLIKEGRRQKRGPLKISTLRRILTSLSVAHQERGTENVMMNAKVKLLLRRANHASANKMPAKKAAITKDILTAILETCNDSLKGVRDRAILLVGFSSGGRRRSEIVRLRVEDLTKIDGGYIIRIRKSKTDQGGRGFEVPILGSTATALTAWLVKSGIREGYIFRGIRSNKKLNDSLTGQSINQMVKTRIALIGLNPDNYGAHSLRSGFITEAARSGATIADAMALSGHRDVVIASGYFREAELMDNPASTLIE